MRVPSVYPPEWGRTKLCRLELEGGEWSCTDWDYLVDPPPGEKLNHGRGGSVPAETLLVVIGDQAVALGDALNVEADNVYAYDCEYYLVLRVREVLAPELWRTLPCRDFGVGNLVHVWDKFHWLGFLRGQSPIDRALTYGGGWADLEELVNREQPPARSPVLSELPGAATLLTAVRANDLPRVESLLARGVSPRDLGVPDGVRCLELDVSHPRSTSPLWEAVQSASPEVTEALLRAGAPVDDRAGGEYTALHVALIARRPDQVRVLLRFGADPLLRCGGKSAHELADGISAELGTLLRGERD